MTYSECPHPECTMVNLCKTHCVARELLKAGWRETKDGQLERSGVDHKPEGMPAQQDQQHEK